MDDFSKALDSLKEMINTPQGQESLNSMLSSFTGDGERSEDVGGALQGLGNYGNILSTLQSGSRAPRMQLMHALKPYLSTRRQQKFDVIMNLMKYSDLPSSLFGKGKR